MRYKLDMDILYELASINLVEIELQKLKADRERELERQSPKKLNGIDYSKERVQGGIVESEEEQIIKIQNLTLNIALKEQLLNDYKTTLDEKKKEINNVLTERQRYIFEETFIKGRTCEDVAEELGTEIKVVLRERKKIMEAINKIKERIRVVKSELFKEIGM